MDNFKTFKRLDEIVENYRRDLFIFDNDSPKPATEADLHKLASMNYYAISGIVEEIKKILN